MEIWNFIESEWIGAVQAQEQEEGMRDVVVARSAGPNWYSIMRTMQLPRNRSAFSDSVHVIGMGVCVFGIYKN